MSTMPELTECLYCPMSSEQPFREAEHVIPQAFGTFESREGNLTLHNVCPECNGFFGRSLEQHFGRDTGDAFLRLLTGLKPVEDASEVGGRRLTSVSMKHRSLRYPWDRQGFRGRRQTSGPCWWWARLVGAVRVHPHKHYANSPVQKDRGAARSVRVRVDGECAVAVLWVRSSEANRSFKCL